MSLRIKILLLVVLPLLALAGAIAWVGYQIEHDLADEQEKILEGSLRASKTKEIESHIKLALSAIAPFLNDPQLSDDVAKAEVKRIINNLRYGQDGYFFVYDQAGVNIVHPILLDYVGKNLINKQDGDGRFVIRELLSAAQQGGGIVRYRWNRPSTNAEEDKVGYVQMLPRWGWMLGSGLYDVSADVENSLKQLQASVHSTFQSILLILATTISLVFTLLFFLNLRESRLADQHLQELVHNFVQLQVDERRQFSETLHASVIQLLGATKRQIERAIRQLNVSNNITTHASGDVCVEILETSLNTLDLTIRQVRDLSHQIRPKLLDEMGLASALDCMLREFEAQNGIATQTKFILHKAALPDDVEITLYRVAEEAMTNIEKYADAHLVTIRLTQTADSVEMEIADDGKGFDISVPLQGGGIGLKIMRDRTELLGGQFHVDSAPARGTTISAVLALNKISKRKS